MCCGSGGSLGIGGGGRFSVAFGVMGGVVLLVWDVCYCCVRVWGVVRYVIRVDVLVPCGVYDCRSWSDVFW